MSAKVLVSRVDPMAPLADDGLHWEPCLICHSSNGTPLGHQAAPCAARVYHLVFPFCMCSRTVADRLTSSEVHRPRDFGSVGTSMSPFSMCCTCNRMPDVRPTQPSDPPHDLETGLLVVPGPTASHRPKGRAVTWLEPCMK